jgi:AcrR family transcriptional regulator
MVRTAYDMPRRLAQAAFEVFGLRGFEAASIDEIAKQAGVTKGSFYSHYGSKHDVIVAACQYYYREYHRRVQVDIAEIVDPRERLRRIVELSVHRCVIDRPSRVFTTEIFALSLQDDEVRAGWSQFYDAVREMFIGLVRAVQASGRVRGGNPKASVDLMLAAMEGVKLRAVFEPHIAEPAEQQAIVAGLMHILLSSDSNNQELDHAKKSSRGDCRRNVCRGSRTAKPGRASGR